MFLNGLNYDMIYKMNITENKCKGVKTLWYIKRKYMLL